MGLVGIGSKATDEGDREGDIRSSTEHSVHQGANQRLVSSLKRRVSLEGFKTSIYKELGERLVPNSRRLFKTIKCFVQTANPSSSIIETFRLIDVDLLLNASVKESSLDVHLFDLEVSCSCDGKERFIAHRFHNRREGLIKVNPSFLFVTLYHPSCLITTDPSFTVPLVLDNPSGLENCAISRSVDECPGVVCFMRADFVFAGGVPFVIINVEGRLFP